MKLRFKFLLLLLPVLLLPSFVRAEERTLTGEWKKIEVGTSIISLEKKGEFIAQLEAKIKALTDASTEDGTVYDYSYRVIREYQEENKSYVPVNVEKQFLTIEDAKEYYNNLEVKGKTNPKYTEVFSDEFELVCEEDCEEEIPSDYVCKINPTETKTVEKTFNSEEKMNAYDETLEGYKFIDKEVTPAEDSVTYTFEGKYNTKRAAKKAIKAFEELYGEKSSYSIYYLRDESKDVGPNTTLGTTKYYDYALAEAAKNALDAEVFDGERTVTIRKESETTTTTYSLEVVVTDKFPTKEKAEAKLAELEGQGYKITSYDIKKHTITGTGIVTAATKIDSNLATYEISSLNNFILLKQASSVVVVWTPTQLSAAAQDNFKTSYKDLNETVHYFDGSTKGDINIEFISGYGEHNLSYLNTNPGSSWGTYTFELSTDGTKIVLYNPSMSLSHIVFGVTSLDTEYYTLEGSMTKEETKDVWYVDKVELLYGYSYYAKASITITTVVYNVIYNYERKTMECSDPKYGLSYEVENLTYKNYIEIEWFIGSQFLGSGDPTPPDTGLFVETESYTKYFMVSFVGLFALFRSRKYIFNK